MTAQLRLLLEADEITASLILLMELPLQGAIVTGNVMVFQRAVGEGIRNCQGEYFFSVKANPPKLMVDLALAFGDAFPPGAGEGGRRGPSIGS